MRQIISEKKHNPTTTTTTIFNQSFQLKLKKLDLSATEYFENINHIAVHS